MERRWTEAVWDQGAEEVLERKGTRDKGEATKAQLSCAGFSLASHLGDLARLNALHGCCLGL